MIIIENKTCTFQYLCVTMFVQMIKKMMRRMPDMIQEQRVVTLTWWGCVSPVSSMQLSVFPAEHLHSLSLTECAGNNDYTKCNTKSFLICAESNVVQQLCYLKTCFKTLDTMSCRQAGKSLSCLSATMQKCHHAKFRNLVSMAAAQLKITQEATCKKSEGCNFDRAMASMMAYKNAVDSPLVQMEGSPLSCR